MSPAPFQRALQPALKKALGQHHLVDGRLCQPLLSFLRPAGERVLEVGPGGGVLTEELLRAGARVWAWELDPEWAFALRPAPALGVVVGDAMTIPWDRLPAPTLATGNLPYAISTALIARILRHPGRVPRSAFLVQKEVGDRLVAGPGDPDYGALSVLVAARAEARLLGRVKAGRSSAFPPGNHRCHRPSWTPSSGRCAWPSPAGARRSATAWAPAGARRAPSRPSRRPGFRSGRGPRSWRWRTSCASTAPGGPSLSERPEG